MVHRAHKVVVCIVEELEDRKNREVEDHMVREDHHKSEEGLHMG